MTGLPTTAEQRLSEQAPAEPSPAGGPAEPLAGAPRSVVVFSDIACPWATVVVLRLREAREALGLTHELPIVHLAHPLEVEHGHALSRRIIDAEVSACAAAAPDFGWSLWQGRLDEYPVSSLLAVEAVQAARQQSEAAAEELDVELRAAFFVRSRCITLRHEVLAAADRCPTVDVARLEHDLDRGVARAGVSRQSRAGREGAATCSGYVVLPDGRGWCNPGVDRSWIGPPMPGGTPHVERDDPSVYHELVRTAAGDPDSPDQDHRDP